LIETKIEKVSSTNPQAEIIQKAVDTLLLGGLVGFPTETVYGLGADALNENAVRKVFEAKGRPVDNPLIVHISEFEQLIKLSSNTSKIAERLAEKFWPGPMTLVVKSFASIPAIVRGGLDTVAVRIPNNFVALELIRKLNRPIVGPSANKSGRPSPTTAQHVYDDLTGEINLILDAGPCKIGIESTVIDITSSPPFILRFGGLTREIIEETIGKVSTTADHYDLKKSPGTRYRHYAPNAKVVLFERGDVSAFDQLYLKYSSKGLRVGYILNSIKEPAIKSDFGRSVLGNIEKFSQHLFSLLRDMDKSGIEVILVESVEEVGLGKAIMDRLTRAAAQ
jgi:L-threonylcarbamoyladenylate synthase